MSDFGWQRCRVGEWSGDRGEQGPPQTNYRLGLKDSRLAV